MERTLVRNRIKHGVDIFIYPGVCSLFIYFLRRFAYLNSLFFHDNSSFLEIAIQNFHEKDVNYFYNAAENLY